MSNQNQVYQAWINAGLSPNQAKIITAEVGRENDYQSQYLWGGHSDPANGKYNLGMLSWQKDRGKKLYNYLNAQGLIKDGKIVQSQQALDAQARFAVQEMRGGSYNRTAKEFLDNPDISYDKGAEVLGTNYIRWRYNDPKYASHHGRRDRYYAKLGGVTAQKQEPTSEINNINPYETEQASVTPPNDLLGGFLNQFTATKTGVEGMEEPTMLKGTSGVMLPENNEENDLFSGILGGINNLGLTTEQEPAYTNAVLTADRANNSLSEKPLVGSDPLTDKINSLFDKVDIL